MIRRRRSGLTLTGLVLVTVVSLPGTESDRVIADFEGDDFGAWQIEGEAFSLGPASVAADGQTGVGGVEGHGYADSNLGGYRLEGTLTSPEFVIERPYLNFLLGGGDNGPLYAALLVDDVEIRTATPVEVDRLVWTTWDVSELLGRSARFRIIDDRSGHVEGFVRVDSIHQSGEKRASPADTRVLFEEMLDTTTENPQPDELPTLGVWRMYDEVYLTARFPEVPGSIFDSWCYETDGATFLKAEVTAGGGIRMTHRVEEGEYDFRWVTEILPQPGEVWFKVRPVFDPDFGESLPETLPIPNLCFQMKRAPAFCSDRSGEEGRGYRGFVERCFIFTESGRTYLDQTERRKIPARPASDPENNPPWVQNYVGVWRERPDPKPDAWADTSSDRYVVPVIGTVSRDGSLLVALADGSADLMCQAWHDCLHTRPKWLPIDAPVAEQTWIMRIYLLPNDPDQLIDRVQEDFPEIVELATKRILSKP